LVVGILGALAAAEGLNRFGSFVSAFDGADSPFYMAMLVISVIGAGVLLLGLFNKSNKIVKWVMFVLLFGCIGLMFNAPNLPVNMQIIIGLVVATVATIFIRTKSKIKESGG
jgi:uncharacterized membrane protein YeaQ/YmgE (transglycosylase-associated protein family)